MPKLLSINSYHYRRGGSDAVYFDHDALFSDIDWQTAFFSMHHPKNVETPWEKYFVDELEFGSEYNVLQKMSMASKVIYSFEAAKNMQRLIDDWQPQISHSHCIYHHLSPSVLKVLHDNGVPNVMTAHDLKLACPAYKMLNQNGICEKCKTGNLTHLLRNKCIHNSAAISGLVMIESYTHRILNLYKKNLDKVVVPSLFFKQKLIEWGWSENSIEYIANFIPADEYEPEYNPGDYILYFGRLAMEKGVGTLIKAANKAGVQLKIAGTGPIEKELKQLAASTNSSAEFLGFCSGDNMKNLIKGARAVVLPSEWYENAPISILEAYASGKIVVGANIGGIPEMIENDETGYLFESGNADQLAQILSKIEGLPNEKIIDMGKRSRQYVTTTFTADMYRTKMLSLYDSLGVH